MLRRFWKNKEGNIAMMSALALVPMMGTLGAGVDFMRASSLSGELQASVDSATLAAANLNNTGDIQAVVDEYVDSNLSHASDFLKTVNVSVDKTVSLNSRTVKVTASGKIQTYFLGLFGIEEIDIDAGSTATQSITNVEIALVLDISSSMKGNKLANLKTASNNFISQMLDEDSIDVTSISIIPFGGTVNIGKEMFEKYSSNPSAAQIDPPKSDYNIGDKLLDEKFLFSDGDYCVEYDSGDFDNSVLKPNGHPQVPHFWKWNKFNPWCPLESSKAVFNSNDKDELTKHITGMTMSDGTGMDIGAMWGLKALSFKWKGKLGGDFKDRPAKYDEETLKILVVMTDGGITSQFRPKDYSRYSTHSDIDASTAADGAGSWVSIPNSKKNKNQQTIVYTGGINTKSNENKAVGYFKRSCDDAQTEGAIVYTIGFKISADSLPDNMLKYCASDLSKYYHVETLDIESAFNSIAASVNALRITD